MSKKINDLKPTKAELAERKAARMAKSKKFHEERFKTSPKSGNYFWETRDENPRRNNRD